MKDRSSCIVIGAGLAGLAAGYELVEAGWAVTVLEAEPKRIGGRVYTYRFNDVPGANELVCELGAEWIGKEHHRLIELCRTFHLPLKKHRFTFSFWHGTPDSRRGPFKPGGWCFSQSAKRGFEEFKVRFRTFGKREQQDLDRYDWWTMLGMNGFSVDELVDRDLMDSTDSGESIRLSSAYLAATEYFADTTTNEMDYKIVGGNDRLPKALATAIRRRGAVHEGAKVTRVEQKHGQVSVYVRDESKPYRAQYCVCAVPTRALTEIQWKPWLRARQVNAANQLQYSRIMKTAVLCAERFWPDRRPDGFAVYTSRASDFCFDSTFGQDGTMGILCSYAIGEKADNLAQERDALLGEWITNDVSEAVRPVKGRAVAPLRVTKQAWQYQSSGGAYAFYRPGQWFDIQPTLSKHHGHVWFAGEHLSEDWQGFMEGAVETGQNAAKAVMKHAGGGRRRSRSS